METFIHQLLDVVEKLLKENRSLYRESERHKQALIDGDISKIESSVQNMGKHVTYIANLEEQRQRLSHQFAEWFGIPPEEITASFLIERIDEKSAKRLEKLTHELQSVIVDLAQSNERNRMLLQTSLQYLNKTIDLVASVTSQDSYGPKKTAQVGVRLFDVQA
jgi:flagellar biosynthesis/type III secretory pathway chaperone